MAAALQVLGVKHTRRNKIIRYNVTLSGNYTNQANGGETIDLTAATNPKGIPDAFWEGNPQWGGLMNGGFGNEITVVPGAAQNAWTLRVCGSANTELGNGSAYNAALTGDTNIHIEIEGNIGGGQQY